MMSEFNVQIDALIVQGVAHFDADLFSAALTETLSGLVTSASFAQPASLSGVWQVAQVAVEAFPGMDSSAMGVEIAHAIYAQIAGGNR